MLPWGVLAIGLALVAAASAVTVRLALRTWKQRKQASPAARLIVVLLAACLLVTVMDTLIGIVEALTAIGGESLEPSQKARFLAEGISEAMNGGVLVLAVGLASAVTAFVLSRARKG